MSNRTDVLIVGAGPVGLVLACELRRRGVSCRIIDKHRDFPSTSRANGLMARSVEVLDNLGIADQIKAGGYRASGVRVMREGAEIARFEGFFDADHGALARPHRAGVLVNQAVVEGALREKLAEFGGQVERHRELRDLQQDAGGVRADVADPDSGSVERVNAKWLVGCDGARSTVRALLELPFEGKDYPDQFVQGDLHLDGDLPRDVGTAWLNEQGLLTGIPFREPGLWRLIAKVHPDAAGNCPRASVELFQRLLVERAQDNTTKVGEPRWLSNFAVHHRIASHYRKGRALVAGDAAHIHSPVGGQGLNAGIQDSYNLGWKLALVIDAAAPTTLLDTYEDERWPAGRKTLKQTDANHRVRVSGIPLAQAFVDRVVFPLLRVPTIQDRAIDWFMKRSSQLDVNYRPSALSEDPGKIRRGPKPGDRAPDGELQDRSGTPTSLFLHFRNPNFRLLLFQGHREATDLTTLTGLGRRMRALTDGLVHPIVIASRAGATSSPDDELTVLRDQDHHAHATYGAGTSRIYLVRPDGHIGFRARTSDEPKLVDYLKRHFHIVRERGVEPRGTN